MTTTTTRKSLAREGREMVAAAVGKTDALRGYLYVAAATWWPASEVTAEGCRKAADDLAALYDQEAPTGAWQVVTHLLDTVAGHRVTRTRADAITVALRAIAYGDSRPR